jgi:hypothetical protein
VRKGKNESELFAPEGEDKDAFAYSQKVRAIRCKYTWVKELLTRFSFTLLNSLSSAL